MNSHPILLIDDDKDDVELFKEAFRAMNVENEIIAFTDADDFLEYIQQTTEKTFLIFCDINMPKLSGLELRKLIFDDKRLRMKCIPFIFLSTSNSSQSVMEAYSFGVQGYFIKPNNFDSMKALLARAMNYWDVSQVPNTNGRAGNR